jgi:ribosomal protein S18 acetylase RimI-like enzyme
MKIDILSANYNNPDHARDLIILLNNYALDPMGGGKALSETVQRQLVTTLANRPDAFSVLAYVDNQPAGLINCFEGFSTFQCKPLVNIHDVVVDKPYRGLGISQMMLEQVETLAKQRGCCKLTLEVLSNNQVAKGAYAKFGFQAYELDPEAGQALFWEKLVVTG